jgi:hypothetical protein
VCAVAFADALVICLLRCGCSAVPRELHCVETLTLLTLTAPRFSEFTDKTFSVAAQST